ncbi:unnamed protein product [Penicillium palitans]
MVSKSPERQEVDTSETDDDHDFSYRSCVATTSPALPVTVQTNVTGKDTSYSDSGVQHLGQLLFNEDLINSVYQLAPYKAHLSTLNRTTNSQDSLYSSANGDGYSAVVDVSKLGDSLADGLAGYITIGVNRSATPAEITGGSVNVVGALPTVTPTPGARTSAYVLDASEGGFEKKR